MSRVQIPAESVTSNWKRPQSMSSSQASRVDWLCRLGDNLGEELWLQRRMETALLPFPRIYGKWQLIKKRKLWRAIIFFVLNGNDIYKNNVVVLVIVLVTVLFTQVGNF